MQHRFGPTELIGGLATAWTFFTLWLILPRPFWVDTGWILQAYWYSGVISGYLYASWHIRTYSPKMDSEHGLAIALMSALLGAIYWPWMLVLYADARVYAWKIESSTWKRIYGPSPRKEP